MTRAKTTARLLDQARASIHHNAMIRQRADAEWEAIKTTHYPIDPRKAGWDGNPDTWSVHYRVRAVDHSHDKAHTRFAARARKEMGDELWAELNREWK